jgi:hypothetical protein
MWLDSSGMRDLWSENFFVACIYTKRQDNITARFMADFGGERLESLKTHGRRGILVSISCFWDKKGAGESRVGEGQKLFQDPPSVLQSKVLSMPKCHSLGHHVLSPNKFHGGRGCGC